MRFLNKSHCYHAYYEKWNSYYNVVLYCDVDDWYCGGLLILGVFDCAMYICLSINIHNSIHQWERTSSK